MKFLPLWLALGSMALAQAAPNTLTEEEKAAGTRLLFDGTRTALKGLQKADFLKAGWTIKDGTLALEKSIQQSGKVTGGDLGTLEPYGDFDFTFEWKMAVSGNAGILYFVTSVLGGKPQGCEFQIIDDVHHPEGLKGGPIRRTGSLFGVLPPKAAAQLKPMEWNTGRLLVQGTHVEHWVNGDKLLEYEAGSPALQQAVKASGQRLPLAFGVKAKTPIVLLDQGEEIAFRNLKIRALAPPAPRPQVVPGSAGGREFPTNPLGPRTIGR